MDTPRSPNETSHNASLSRRLSDSFGCLVQHWAAIPFPPDSRLAGGMKTRKRHDFQRSGIPRLNICWERHTEGTTYFCWFRDARTIFIIRSGIPRLNICWERHTEGATYFSDFVAPCARDLRFTLAETLLRQVPLNV